MREKKEDMSPCLSFPPLFLLSLFLTPLSPLWGGGLQPGESPPGSSPCWLCTSSLVLHSRLLSARWTTHIETPPQQPQPPLRIPPQREFHCGTNATPLKEREKGI
jgi:hypothetical protein